MQAAQGFLRGWQWAQLPINGYDLSAAVFPQPERIVINGQHAARERSRSWRLELSGDGGGAAARLLAHATRRPDTGVVAWPGSPGRAWRDVETEVLVPRSRLECSVYDQLCALVAWSGAAGAGGRLTVRAVLLAPEHGPAVIDGVPVHSPTPGDAGVMRLVDERREDGGSVANEWVPTPGALDVSATDSAAFAASVVVTRAAPSAASARLGAARDVATKLLSLFAVAEPRALTATTIDPAGAGLDDQLAWQHARDVGLPHDELGPADVRNRFAAEVAAARRRRDGSP